jgi:hypothetical protein
MWVKSTNVETVVIQLFQATSAPFATRIIHKEKQHDYMEQ